MSQGVELVKTKAKSAAGLANAVLHRVSENAEAFMATDAHRFGLPSWLLGRVSDELGSQAATDYGQACLAPAPVYVANVPMWISDKRALEAFEEAGIVVRAAGAVPGSWQARDVHDVVASDLFGGDEVKAVVADYGAQAVAYLAAPEPGDRMLEVGSGRATKTILMAGHLHRAHGAARMWALDVHASRTGVARQRLAAARVANVTLATGDARDLDAIPSLAPSFERILLDAPCTGTGTLRRLPEIAWGLAPDDITACAAKQLELLTSCAGRVSAGGVVVYATCSVLREEDEDVVSAFLGSEAGASFEVVPVSQAAGDADVADELASHQTPEGYLRFMMRPDGCDGHFCAVLRRK